MKRTFTDPSNGYLDVTICKWFPSFEWEIVANLAILELPVRSAPLRGTGDDLETDSGHTVTRSQQSDCAPNSIQTQQNQRQLGRYGRSALWAVTLFCPYIPGVSERLKSLSARCGIRHWQSYGGKISDLVCNFKDKFHCSKSMFSVYTISCFCGTCYLRESGRNLKIRLHEHSLKSSKSSISLHMKDENEKEKDNKHKINPESATLITQERNIRKRKFIESACIKARRASLCNTGPSLAISDVWDPSLPKIAKRIEKLE